MTRFRKVTTVLLCRYNKPLLPKYKAAEDSVQATQAAIEKKIATRRINQVQPPSTYVCVLLAAEPCSNCSRAGF